MLVFQGVVPQKWCFEDDPFLLGPVTFEGYINILNFSWVYSEIYSTSARKIGSTEFSKMRLTVSSLPSKQDEGSLVHDCKYDYYV